MPKKSQQIPSDACRFAAGSATMAEGNRFSLTPFAGQVFEHWYWGKMTFDAAGISLRKPVIPAFKDHDPMQLVGEIDEIAVVDGAIRLSGGFIESDAADQVRSTKKLEWECSLAFDMNSAVVERLGKDQRAQANGADVVGPATIIRKATLYETSFTFFGAVPGTEASFKESGPSSVLQEVTMSEDIKKVQDDAKADALGLFKKMSAMSSDKTFVAESYEKGLSIEQFQAELIRKQEAHIAKLSADLAKAIESRGSAPAQFSAPAEPVVEKNFIELAHELAKTEKITIRQAYSRIAAEKPEVYKDHLEKCPAQKRSK